MSSLPKDLLDIMACPQCRGPLQVETASLRCDTCMLRYRVENGIPVMLISEAEHVQDTGHANEAEHVDGPIPAQDAEPPGDGEPPAAG
jgi:uncharacterized protein YbaR (Trm112 family)